MDSGSIGKKIRNLRLQLDLTAEDLADRCELSKGFISQLENGKTSTTIETLNDICIALGTTLSKFFEEEKETTIIYKDADLSVLEEEKYITQWLLPNAQKCEIEPIMLEIRPNGESEQLEPFEGETFGYIIEGEVHIQYGKNIYKAIKGNTFHTKCRKTMKLINKTDKAVKLFWVTTPPAF